MKTIGKSNMCTKAKAKARQDTKAKAKENTKAEEKAKTKATAKEKAKDSKERFTTAVTWDTQHESAQILTHSQATARSVGTGGTPQRMAGRRGLVI